MWWLLLACAGGSDTEAPICDTGDDGIFRGCVAMDEASEGIEGGRIFAKQGEGTPIEARTGDDGCAEIPLAPGSWTVWGEDDTGFCVHEEVEVGITACETTSQDFYVIDRCVDG
jgi:hypothetical protein